MSERRRRDQRTDQIIIEIAKGGPVLAALRIQELEAKLARMTQFYSENKELHDMEYKWGVRTCFQNHPYASWQMKGKTPKECPFCRTKELEARLQRVGELPERWQEISYKATEDYTDLHGCADELQAALEKDDE